MTASAAAPQSYDHEDRAGLEHRPSLMVMEPRESKAPGWSVKPGESLGLGAPGEREDAARAYAAAAAVLDPEVPVLTIADLGILRGVEVDGSGTVTATITPTYSGCPAMDAIRTDITSALHAAGFPQVDVRTVLAPAWTTDWMTSDGKAKLRSYGIAPPEPRRNRPVPLALSVRCPRCGSGATRELSRFGSTACKSLWVCTSCAEPFDHFKAI